MLAATSLKKPLPPLPSQDGLLGASTPLVPEGADASMGERQPLLVRKALARPHSAMSTLSQGAASEASFGARSEPQHHVNLADMKNREDGPELDARVEDDSRRPHSASYNELLADENEMLREEVVELRRAFVENLRGKHRRGTVSGGNFRTVIQPKQRRNDMSHSHSSSSSSSASSSSSSHFPASAKLPPSSSTSSMSTSTSSSSSSGAGPAGAAGSGNAWSMMSSASSSCSNDEDILGQDTPLRLVQHERDLQVAKGMVQALQREIVVARAEKSRTQSAEDAYKTKIERQSKMISLMQQRIARDSGQANRLREQLKAKTDLAKKLHLDLELEKEKNKRRKHLQGQYSTPSKSQMAAQSMPDGWTSEDTGTTDAQHQVQEVQLPPRSMSEVASTSASASATSLGRDSDAVPRPTTRDSALKRGHVEASTLERPRTAPSSGTSASTGTSTSTSGGRNQRKTSLPTSGAKQGPRKPRKKKAGSTPPSSTLEADELDVHTEYLKVMLKRADAKAEEASLEASTSAQAIKKRDAELSQLRKRFSTVSIRVQELNAKIVEAERSEEGNLKRIAQLEQRVRELESRGAKDEELARQYEKEVYDLHGRLERAAQEARAAEMQTEALGRDCEHAMARHHELSAEVAAWKAKSSSIDKVGAELLENKATLARVLAEKEDLKSLVHANHDVQARARSAVKDSEAKVHSLEAQLEHVRQAYANLNAEQAQLREILGADSGAGKSRSLREALLARLEDFEHEVAKQQQNQRRPAPRLALHVVSPTVNVTVVQETQEVLNSSESVLALQRGGSHRTASTDLGKRRKCGKAIQCRVKVDRTQVKRCIEDNVLPKFLKMYLSMSDDDAEGDKAPKKWIREITSSLQRSVEGSLTRLYAQCEK